MPGLSGYYFSWGIIVQALAIIHFIRRRPDTFWLWIILMGGGLGAIVYLFMEAIPDLGLLKMQFQVFERRKRIKELEGIIHDNPAAGNLEDLALVLFENKEYARAKECYDRAISSRTDSIDPYYRRAQCEIELGDFTSAVPDLERVVTKDSKHDFMRAQGLLAHAYAHTGRTGDAARIFASVTEVSTFSETMLNYADFLRAQGKTEDARLWAKKVLNKKPGMPSYLRRRERPYFRRASALLGQLPK